MQENSHGSDTTTTSPSMVGLRTTVMIAFLVSIPLLAVVGTGLPGSLRRAVSGGEPSFSSRSASAATSAPASPSSLVDGDPPGPADAALPAPRPEAQMPQPSSRPVEAFAAVSAPEAPPARPVASVTEVRVESSTPRARIVGVRGVPDRAPPAATAPLWAPAPRTAASSFGRQTTAHFESSQRQDPARLGKNASKQRNGMQATAYSTSPADDSADALARSEQRLRELGAGPYRLETWGESGQLFRCTAYVTLPGHRRTSRHFSAVAASPAKAVELLLQDIEERFAARR